MFRFEYFDVSKEKEWDKFIDEKSINGTFLQSRRFLNYHAEGKFKDVSLMIYNAKNNLAAICPACEQQMDEGRTFFSHKGTTFGGIIIDRKHYNGKYVVELISELKEFLKEEGFVSVYLKQTSDIFSLVENDLFQYAYCYQGFREYKELSTYIDYSSYKDEILSNFSQGKRTNVHNCIKEGMIVKALTEEHEIAEFYEILCENLKKYDTKPVHTLDELLEFKDTRLIDECGFYGVYKDKEMLAGSMMFYFPRMSCAHTQYLAARQEYNKLSPMSFLYYSMIEKMREKGYKKLSWGTATEDLGRVLNIGLLTSKEDFGSSYCNNLTYYCHLD